MPEKQDSDFVLAGLREALGSDKGLAAARKGQASAEERLSQLQARQEELQKQREGQALEMSELEAKRIKLLGTGKDVKAVEAEIMEAQGRLNKVDSWCARLAAEDVPGAIKALEDAKRAVAVAVAEAIGKHQEGLERRLRDDLLTVWHIAESWREAKKSAWQDLGINPEIMRGLRRTVIYLPDIAPELKDAFGTARAGQGY